MARATITQRYVGRGSSAFTWQQEGSFPEPVNMGVDDVFRLDTHQVRITYTQLDGYLLVINTTQGEVLTERLIRAEYAISTYGNVTDGFVEIESKERHRNDQAA